MSVIYLMSDGANEWEVPGDEWLRTGTGQGFTSFSGPEYSGRRQVAVEEVSHLAKPITPGHPVHCNCGECIARREGK